MTGKPLAPTLRPNGTGFDELLAGYRNAADALSVAVGALPAPKWCDYYTEGDALFHRAEREHADRAARLRSVLDELVAICGALQKQNDAGLPKRPR